MAYTVENLRTLGKISKVLVTADTTADIPEPEEHWAVGSTCEVLEDGGTKYRLSNAGEWVKVNFDVGGGGNSADFGVPEFAYVDSRQWRDVNQSGMPDYGAPIAGHDAFYIPMGYGNIRKVPFDGGAVADYPVVCPDTSTCWLTHIAYGDGLYFGADTKNGGVYTSEDAVNWALLGDVHITPQNISLISFANGMFYFTCSDGVIGNALKSENYSRVTECTGELAAVAEAGVVQAVYSRFGNEFFAMDSGIIAGNRAGVFARIPYLEETPDEMYLASTAAFWNNHLVMFDGMSGLLCAMPMRYPHDAGGYFIVPDWVFCNANNRNEVYSPLGVGAYGENLLIFTDRNVYCIDRNGEMTQMLDDGIHFNSIRCVLVSEKTILACTDSSQAYQFFVK